MENINPMDNIIPSYLSIDLSEEDKFWYDESEKGLEFSNEEFWKDIYVKNDVKDNL